MSAGGASMTAWPECLLPQAELSPPLAREIRGMIGRGPAFVPRLAHAPWVVRSIARIIDLPSAHLSSALGDRIGLVVAQDNSCRYCYGMMRSLLRVAGRSEAEVDRIVRDSLVVDLSPAERAAVEYARRVSRCNPRPGPSEFQAMVAAGVDPQAGREIALQATFGSFMNRISTLAALPPEPLEAMTAAPYFRFIRPLIARGFRKRPARPQPPPRNEGPCARVVAALGDLPAAHVVRATIDEACASPILPVRTKALIMAVVARALDCVYGEREARAMLEREGFAAADVDQVLETLSSPRLDAREARLVPFARETIRYQPAVIQARAREVCRDLSPAESTELLGMIALTNAICRLSVLLDPQ
jgi:AhpD family alkylhydroperoxidase